MAFPYDVLSWLIRGRYKISLPTVSDGGTPELAMDAQGRPRVVVDSMPGSGSSAYTHYNLTTPNSKGTIKASAGALRQVVINNDHTSELWVCLFNKASTPLPIKLVVVSWPALSRSTTVAATFCRVFAALPISMAKPEAVRPAPPTFSLPIM